MRHCKAELFKITQSRGFLGALLGKSAGLLMKVTVPLTKNFHTIRKYDIDFCNRWCYLKKNVSENQFSHFA